MQKFAKKTLSILMVAFMLLSTLAGIVPVHVHAASFSSVNGWYETIVAEISGVSDADVTGVSYSGAMSGSLTGDDLTHLVRSTSGGVRIDIPGLKAGTYTLTVETSSGTLTKSGISVVAYDRSGYAHWNNTEGVGAYNDDGTLKSNAVVLYVTDSNKNTVSLSCGGTTVTGIGHILNSAGMDTGSGTCANGSSDTNNNAGILQKLSAAGIPLVIRIVGNVTAPSGLTAYDSTSYGGSVGDNGYMARMKDAMNVTIEGIGNDASINGWGIHFMCTESYPNYGKNFEVRNIAFKNVPEDCIGMEGVQSGSTLTASVERCWIHHCSFTGPSISNPAESDKDGGDGAVDFKRGQYFTNSYCIYNGYHKTNLVGASDSNVQYHITYHHNYYKNCESRGPLARTANIHIYNNVYENQSSYCMSLRADTYIFSESNTFIASKVTDGKTGGVCKSYNNSIDSDCTKTDPLTIVSSKSTTVSSDNKYANFDTNSSMGYVASGDYILETASASYNTVMASAGPMTTGSAATPDDSGSSGGTEGGTDTPVSTTAPSDGSSGGTVAAGDYAHNFETNGKTSSFYTISGNTSTSKGSVTVNGVTISQCLKMESATSITFDAPSAGTLQLVFGSSETGKRVKVDGTEYTTDSNGMVSVDIAAGSHSITKGDSINLFYMVYTPAGDSSGGETHTHSYTEAITTAATCGAAGVKTFTCSCGDSYTEAIPATGNHSYSNGACTVCGLADTSTCTHANETSVVTAPTCTAAGYTTYTCTSCGNVRTGNTVAATGHTGGAAATCTTAQTCIVCGTTITAALGHNYSNGSCTRCGAEETALSVGGWFESAWAEWAPVDGASGYNVYYKSESGSWTQIDAELIRNYGDYWRADVVGLSAGKYQLCVAPVISGSTGTHMHSDQVTVIAHNRDGYAHTNGSVGAYNNDGTLKDNAVVVYVTADNIDSVTANISGTTYTGLDNIVYTGGKKGSVPICVRIIGEIDGRSTQVEIKENVVGITVEGIGKDATCNGWGVYLSKADNVEVRNLAFMNNATDEGDSVTLANCTYCWVHNCDFFYGTDRGGDKNKGDGALDTKTSENITHSYNHFWDCGKCNLQGSGTSDTSDNITYHHNWYDHSDSRHPRVRVATVHVYNNYYDGVSKYGIGNAYKAEVISEGNYFRNTKNPMLTSTQGSDVDSTMSGETPGTLTSYKDYVVGATSWIPNVDGIQGATSWSATDYDCVIVDTPFDGYSYTLQTAEEAKTNVTEYAGRVNGGDFEFTFTEADDTDYERNASLDAALTTYTTSMKSIGGNSVTEEHVNCSHSSTTTTTTAATCTVAGSTVEKCTECGTVVSTTPITALGHNYVNGTCSRCGLIDASTCAHSNETSVVTAPTCTAGGYTTYTCTACGTTRIADQVAATGHTAGAAATCTTAQTCTVCGATVTAALGHNYVNGICSRCGAEDLAASGYVHNFTENGTTSTFYTISGNLSTSKGSVTYEGLTLTQCLKIESSTSISFTAPSAGTLTLVFGGSTSASGKAIKIDGTSTDIDSTQILTVNVAAGSHTITKDDSIFLFYMVYAPEGSSSGDTHTHSYTETVTTAATCETAGVKTFSCSCGDSYTEAIPALGHSYSSVVTAPTCTEGGYTTYTCSCGDSYTGNQTAALGHSYSSSVTKVPDCTNAGVRTFTCSACGDSYTETIAATGHTEVTVAGYAATCTSAGLTDGTKCSVCSEILTAQTEIPALGHTNAAAVKENEKAATCAVNGSYDSVVYCSVCTAEVSRTTVTVPATGEHVYATETKRVEATCTVDGYVIMACGCGATQQTALKATGHTEVTVAGYAATCTASGLTDGTKCSVCSEILTAQTEIPALGHTNAAAVKENEKAATCTADGSYDNVVYCSVCRAEVSRTTVTVEAAGHTLVTDAAVAPTCTAAGKTEGQHCSVCGEVTVAQQTVDALGHKFVDGVCTVCGAADPEYVAGVAVSGKYTSYNDAADVLTIQLIAEGMTEPAYVFTNEAAPANAGEWSIEGVAPGSYTVKVMKADHVTREYALTVGNAAAELDVVICLLGDANTDGRVNISDYVSVLTQVKNPGEAVLVDYRRQCADVNGDGNVSFLDYMALLSHVKNVNRLW